MKKLAILLVLSACGGSPAASLLTDPALDAGDPREAATLPGDASGRQEASAPPPGTPDAGEAKPDAGPTPLEAGLPVRIDAGTDATPGACQATACSGFVGACGAVELECGGSLAEFSCGTCGSGGAGQTENACGDNGSVGHCGNTCMSNSSATNVCTDAGYPSAWAVLTDCGGTPWRWEGGGPVFRPEGRTGCVVATYDAASLSGITTALCCP